MLKSLPCNILHSKRDIRNFSAPWTAFVPRPPLPLNQKPKNYEPFHDPPVESAMPAQRGNYDESANMFPPGRRVHPLPGGEGRGEGERKSNQFHRP